MINNRIQPFLMTSPDGSLLGQRLPLGHEYLRAFDNTLGYGLTTAALGRNTIENTAQSNLANSYLAEEGLKSLFNMFGFGMNQSQQQNMQLLQQRQYYDTFMKQQEGQQYTRMILEKLYNMEEEINRNEMSNRFQLAKNVVGMARYG